MILNVQLLLFSDPKYSMQCRAGNTNGISQNLARNVSDVSTTTFILTYLTPEELYW